MTDPVWYYARGDVEKGPLSTAQMRALAAAGKIRPEDLVWKEGMETWVPASEMPDLFPAGAAKTNGTEIAAEAGEGQPVERQPSWAAPSGGATTGFLNRRQIGQFAALMGFCTALLCRGCEELSDRHVARLQAALTIAQARHEAEWDGRQRQLTERLAPLEAAATRTPKDQEQLRQLQTQASQLQVERERAERYVRDTQWSQLEMAAELADAESDQAAYWRGVCFVVGTVVLAGGLLLMASDSDGAQRWMSLAALLVLLYAVYSGAAF